MAIKKFELTDETKKFDNKILYRIKAIIQFSNVHEGDIGGFVSSERNLSHEGNCWIYDDSMVTDKAVIKDDAIVCDDSWVTDEAIIQDNAEICNSAIVSGKSLVKDEAIVDGGQVSNNSIIEGNCTIQGFVSGHAKIGDSVIVKHGGDVNDAEVIGTTVVVNGCEINGDIKVKYTGNLKPITITPETHGSEFIGESKISKFKKTTKLLKEALDID